MSLEMLNRHSEVLFEFLWCPVCGQDVFTHIPFEGVFCKNCNTQVVLRESRENRGYEEAVLACFDTDSTWNLHVDEKLRRDLPDGSARVKILGARGSTKSTGGVQNWGRIGNQSSVVNSTTWRNQTRCHIWRSRLAVIQITTSP